MSTTTKSKASGKGTIANNSFTNKPVASLTLNTTSCAYSGTNTLKGTKAATEAGTCVISATGTMQGYCGLSTGQMSGTMAPASPTPASNTAMTFNIKFTEVGTTVINGTVTKTSNGETGKIKGTANFTPDPTAGSCLNKASKRFTVEWTWAIKICNNGKNATTNLCN